MSFETVKCTHCGYVYPAEIERAVADGKATIVRGLFRKVNPQPSNEADLTCPNCKKVFEWPVKR